MGFFDSKETKALTARFSLFPLEDFFPEIELKLSSCAFARRLFTVPKHFKQFKNLLNIVTEQ